jgi:hypothetical protein
LVVADSGLNNRKCIKMKEKNTKNVKEFKKGKEFKNGNEHGHRQ